MAQKLKKPELQTSWSVSYSDNRVVIRAEWSIQPRSVCVGLLFLVILAVLALSGNLSRALDWIYELLVAVALASSMMSNRVSC